MLTHRLFGGGSSSLSVSRPSLGPALVVVARARLWSSFRRRSESPLLARCETKRQEKVSCLFGSCRLFPSLHPSQLWCANPFRLCSRCQPQSSPCDPTEARASAPSPRPPRRVSRQASRAGECCSAPSLRAGISPLCPLHPCGCALLRGSKAPHLRHPQSLPTKGLLVCGNLSSFTAPSARCSPIPIILSLFLLFSFAQPRYVGSFLPFGKSEVFCQHSVGVL